MYLCIFVLYFCILNERLMVSCSSLFGSFSRSLDEYVDEHKDMVLTVSPCGSAHGDLQLNTGHMLVQNTKSSLSTFRSAWLLWNHTKCKE